MRKPHGVFIYLCHCNPLIIDTTTQHQKWHFCDCISTTRNPLVASPKWLCDSDDFIPCRIFFAFIRQWYTRSLFRLPVHSFIHYFAGTFGRLSSLAPFQNFHVAKIAHDMHLYGKCIRRFIYLGTLCVPECVRLICNSWFRYASHVYIHNRSLVCTKLCLCVRVCMCVCISVAYIWWYTKNRVLPL